MIKFARTLLITVLLFVPLLGICQIATPKWVDDIGGPSSNCISSAVKVDKQNNVYVTGFYDGTADFDPSGGVYNLTASGGSFDIFVAKYTSAGALIWAKSFGGNGIDQVNSMTVDINGNPIISGQFNSTGINVGSTTIQNQGVWNAFIIKLNTNGGLVWAKSVGGSSTDYGAHVASDSQGNLVQCIRFTSSFSLGGKSYSSSNGSFNALTVKYDPNGNVLWAINLPDPGTSESIFSEFDSQNNTVVCGRFDSNDNFNPLGTAHTLNGNGGSTYIAKYSPAGILIWVNSFAGTVVGDNTNLCINSKDDIFLEGPFTSVLTFGTVSLYPSGNQDIFLSKYSSAGVFQSVGDIGGSYAKIFNYGVVSSKDDYIYVSGYFSGTIDFDPSSTSKALVSDHGLQDFFLAKYDSNLNYKWAFNGGNNSCDQNLGRNVAIDNNNDVLFTGGFCSTVNFSASVCNPVIRTAQSTSRDCFLAKYTQSTATTQAEITSFSVPQQTQSATIDQTNLIITVTVPSGTNVKALVPTIAYTSGVTLLPASGAAQDFTDPVTYTLATSCSSLNYTVNVVFAAGTTTQTICSATSTTLTGAALTTTPTSYTWQVLQGTTWVNAQGTINAKDYTTPALTNTTTSPVVYSYRRQVIAGGTTTYDSRYDVTVIPAVANNTITAPPIASLCGGGDPGIIGGSIATGGTGSSYVYQWQTSADNVTFTNVNGATAQNYDPTLVTTTTYYRRTLVSGACSTPLISNVVTVYVLTTLATPVPTAATVSVCTGSTAGLSVSNPQAGVTYNWYDSATKTTLLHTGTNYTTNILTGNTTYYIEATNGSCTSASMATVQVNIVALPVAPVLVANSTSTCYGGTVTLTDTDPQGGHYNWYTTPTGGTAVASGVTFTTGAITQNTTYYVEDVNATGCTSATRTKFDITVIPLPAAPQIQTPAPVCSGTASTLSIANPQAGLTYNWYATATGGIVLATGTSYTQTDLTSNTYYADAVNANSCVSATRTQVTITPIAIPAAPQVSTPAGICSGSTITLAVTTPQANINYNWYDAATGGTLLASGNSYTTTALTSSTIYYVEAVSSVGGCTSTTRTAVNVNVTQPPVTPVPVSPTVSVCSGSTATLSVSNPQSITYNWYDSATKTNLLFTGPSYTTKPLTTNTTVYIEAVSGPCTSPAMASVQVNIIALPAAPVIVKSPVSTCSGTQVTLSVANPQASLTYNWYSTATGGTSVFTGTDFLTPKLTSSTTYYVEAVNSNSCTSSTRTAASVTVNPTPGITTQNISICPGTSGTILASSTDPNVTISWYSSLTSTSALATGSSFKTPVLNNNAIYYAEAVDNTTGCISSSRSIATVTMYQQLAAPVVVVNNTTATTVTFSWDAVDGASGYLVSVDGGVSFNTPSSGSSGLTHTVTGLKLSESVTIMVEATGVSTCQLSGSSTAVTGVAHDSVHDIIYVANAFTPNGDGVNDVVYVHSEDIRSMTFYVYDQWGEMLFKSTSQSVGWDGTYKGTKQPVGVYVYYVQAVMNDGQKVTKKGTITLLK